MKTSDDLGGHSSATARRTLIVDGARCGSCVKKIEAALSQVEGVREAEMNFVQRTVRVVVQHPDVSDAALIAAVAQAGYAARISQAEREGDALAEKEEADEAYYQKLMRDMWLALAIGVPLMMYGLWAGETTVTTNMERGVWLGVGLLTLGVMVFSGKHFYLGAWQSFQNHSANMDTLIALGTGTAWLYSMFCGVFSLISAGHGAPCLF